MSQEDSGSAAVGNALFAVAQFRIGRILMWIVATPFLFVGSLGFIDGGGPGGKPFGVLFAVGFFLALVAFIGAWKERRKNSPSPVRWFLIRLALAGLVLGGAMLVTWLLRRRSKAAAALPPPPRPEEVDQLCGAQELVG